MNSGSNTAMQAQIRVLGDFQLVVDGQTHVVSAQKNKALLAWLAFHLKQPQPRDRLAGLLWADRGAANAKASLRQAVAGLRRLLPQGSLISAGEYLRLNADAVSVDIHHFRAWRDAMDKAALQAALAHYRGELLDGFNARSEAFDEWLLLERETLRGDALAGLAELLDRERGDGDLTAAIAVGGRLLALDPLQEAVHRQLMQMYADLGQFGSAQRQFKLCRDVLQRELGSAPAPETVNLFRSLGGAGEPVTEPDPQTTSVAVNAVPISVDEDRSPVLPNIAVLPFRLLSSIDEHEYLADGMTEELINLLTQSVNWRVTARNISFQYRDKQPDVRSVGAELGVAYAVEGSIRSMGERVRISAALVSTSDGTQIWSDRYDRPLADLFDVQDELVHAIFRTLKNRLGFAERERVRRTPRTNLDAWGLLIKAMQINVVSAETHLEQLELVREALQIEPTYPRAHAYLASLLFTAVGRGTSPDPKAYAVQAQQHMERALAGGASDVVVLKMCAGGFAAIGESQHALGLAERAFQMTGSPDPLWVAVLMWNGRLEEAHTYCEQIVDSIPAGITLPPGELRPVALLGNLLMLQDRLEEALVYTLQDQRENPGNFFSHVNVANLQGLLGHDDEAAAAWQLAKTMVPKLSVRLFAKGYTRVFADSQLADRFSAGLLAAGLE